MKGQDRTNSPVSTDTRQKRQGRRSGGRRIAKRIILFMLATFVMVIVGSMTYVLVVPLVMMLDFPGAVSDGAEAAGSVGDRMADVTDTIQKKTEEQINANSGDGPPNTVTGTITKVVDGDTIDVDNVRIRLTLVNTPERGESGYSDAVAFTKQHCPVGTIAVYDPDEKQTSGSYGRTIAKVWCYGHDQAMPNASINAMLVERGHAEILTRFCYTSEFSGQQWAQDNGC